MSERALPARMLYTRYRYSCIAKNVERRRKKTEIEERQQICINASARPPRTEYLWHWTLALNVHWNETEKMPYSKKQRQVRLHGEISLSHSLFSHLYFVCLCEHVLYCYASLGHSTQHLSPFFSFLFLSSINSRVSGRAAREFLFLPVPHSWTILFI